MAHCADASAVADRATGAVHVERMRFILKIWRGVGLHLVQCLAIGPYDERRGRHLVLGQQRGAVLEEVRLAIIESHHDAVLGQAVLAIDECADLGPGRVIEIVLRQVLQLRLE